jgi:hypothetical protein
MFLAASFLSDLGLISTDWSDGGDGSAVLLFTAPPPGRSRVGATPGWRLT